MMLEATPFWREEVLSAAGDLASACCHVLRISCFPGLSLIWFNLQGGAFASQILENMRMPASTESWLHLPVPNDMTFR